MIVLLSHFINEQTPLYAGAKTICLKRKKSFRYQQTCQETYCSFPAHTGTHVDAPLHFLQEGNSVTDFSAGDWLFRKVALVEPSNISSGKIIKELKETRDCELLLIKTGFEKYRDKDIYWRNSPALDPELAPVLKSRYPSLRAVGVDFISIANLNHRRLGRKAHRVFFENNLLLIEDMRLSVLKKAPERVIIAPLLIEKSDGAPCTVFALNGKKNGI